MGVPCDPLSRFTSHQASCRIRLPVHKDHPLPAAPDPPPPGHMAQHSVGDVDRIVNAKVRQCCTADCVQQISLRWAGIPLPALLLSASCTFATAPTAAHTPHPVWKLHTRIAQPTHFRKRLASTLTRHNHQTTHCKLKAMNPTPRCAPATTHHGSMPNLQDNPRLAAPCMLKLQRQISTTGDPSELNHAAAAVASDALLAASAATAATSLNACCTAATSVGFLAHA